MHYRMGKLLPFLFAICGFAVGRPLAVRLNSLGQIVHAKTGLCLDSKKQGDPGGELILNDCLPNLVGQWYKWDSTGHIVQDGYKLGLIHNESLSRLHVYRDFNKEESEWKPEQTPHLRYFAIKNKKSSMIRKQKAVDIMFVMDVSGSISPLEYTDQIDFLSKVVSDLDFTGNNRLGIIAFDGLNYPIRNLTTGNPLPDLLALRPPNGTRPGKEGGTESLKAVLMGAEKLKKSKKENTKVMILLSDGQDYNARVTMIPTAYAKIREDIRNNDYSTISIGVGDDVDKRGLLNFVNEDASRYYKVDDFSALDGIVRSIVSVADPGEPLHYAVVNGILRNQNGGCVKLESDIYKIALPCIGIPVNFESDQTKALKNKNKNRCMSLKGVYQVQSVPCDPLDVRQRWIFEKAALSNHTQMIVNELTGWCLQGDSWDPSRLILGTCPFDDGPDWNNALWDIAL